MRKPHWLLLAFLVCLNGCVPVDSLNPFYSDQNVVFEPGLIGQWSSDDPNTEISFRFDRDEGDAYQVVETQKEPSGATSESVYTAHLIHLGERSSWT